MATMGVFIGVLSDNVIDSRCTLRYRGGPLFDQLEILETCGLVHKGLPIAASASDMRGLRKLVHEPPC
jgi:hypothetical protein